jgi:hypothetical protein
MLSSPFSTNLPSQMLGGNRSDSRDAEPGRHVSSVLSPALLLVVALGALASLAYTAAVLDADRCRTIYAVIHALLAYALAYSCVSVLAIHAGDRVFYPPCIVCLLHILYFTASATSYFSDNPVCPEFDLSLETRLFGNLIVAAVLGIFVAILRRHLAALHCESAWRAANPPSTVACAVLVLIAIGLKLRLIEQGFGSPYSDAVLSINTAAPDELIAIILCCAFGYFTMAVAAIGFYRRKTPAAQVILWAAIIGEVLWHALFTSSRSGLLSTIIVAGLIIASSAIRTRPALVYASLFVIVTSGPLAIGVGNSAFLAALGRNAESSLQDSCDETANRLALADLAMVFVRSPASWNASLDVLRDSVECNMPRILLPDKATSSQAISNISADAGIYDRDYSDTLFSAGAMLGGLPGMIALPCLYMMAVCAGASWLTKRALKSDLCNYLLLGMTICCMNIELGPIEIVAAVRLLIGVYLPLSLAFWLVSSLRVPPRMSPACAKGSPGI